MKKEEVIKYFLVMRQTSEMNKFLSGLINGTMRDKYRTFDEKKQSIIRDTDAAQRVDMIKEKIEYLEQHSYDAEVFAMTHNVDEDVRRAVLAADEADGFSDFGCTLKMLDYEDWNKYNILSLKLLDFPSRFLKYQPSGINGDFEADSQPLEGFTRNASEEENHSQGCAGNKYSKTLLELFHNRVNLIEELIGKSDDEIASLIKKWANEKDKLGKPLIENPKNNLRKKFADELKAAGIIKQAARTFRNNL